MGQIVSSAAKPKRCNANQLSQVPTPAAGEHILVSSDNSMNAAGQGNFDCYIEGDGQKAATALELKAIAELEITASKNSISAKAVNDFLNGKNEEQKTYPELTWTNGYINESGNLAGASGQYRYSNVLELQAGETAVANAAGNGVAAIGVWNSATTKSSSLITCVFILGVSSITEFTYTATEHCYIRFGHNFAVDGSSFYISKQVQQAGFLDDYNAVKEKVEELDEGAGEVVEKINGKTENITTELTPTWNQGYLTDSGAISVQSSGTYYYSDVIPVAEGDIVRCHIKGQGIGVIVLYSLVSTPASSVIAVVAYDQPIDSEHPNDYELVCSQSGYIRFCYKSGAIENESWSVTEVVTSEPVYKDVQHLRIAEWNFGLFNHGVQTDGQIGIPDADVDTILPTLKEQFVNIAADLLYVTEYSQYVDRSQTMNTYDTLLKQFYPYKYITGDRGSAIFSKFPFTAKNFVSLDSRTYIDGKMTIHGQEVRIFLMHPRSMSGQSGVDTRVADINQVITYLADSPYVIIAGDMNTFQVVELDPFKTAGYLCGNCGYQGNMNTYPDPNREWYIDNVIVKGFNMDKFEVIEEPSVSDHYPVRGYITAYL